MEVDSSHLSDTKLLEKCFQDLMSEDPAPSLEILCHASFHVTFAIDLTQWQSILARLTTLISNQDQCRERAVTLFVNLIADSQLRSGVVRSPIVPALHQILIQQLKTSHQCDPLIDACLMAFGNIAIDGESRLQLHALGVLPTIAAFLLPYPHKSAVWAASIFCNSPVAAEHYQSILEPFSQLCQMSNLQEEIRFDLYRGLFSLTTHGFPELLQYFHSKGVFHSVAEYIRAAPHQSDITIRLMGNLVAGSNEQSSQALSYNILPSLVKTFRESSDYKVRKEIAWIFANIAAATQEQIQCLFNENVMPLLFQAVRNDVQIVKVECFWALSNVLIHGSPAQVSAVLQRNVISLLQIALCSIDNEKLARAIANAIVHTIRVHHAEEEVVKQLLRKNHFLFFPDLQATEKRDSGDILDQFQSLSVK